MGMKDTGGLAFSLLAHALLIILATIWVVSTTPSSHDEGARTFVAASSWRTADSRRDVFGGGEKETPRRIQSAPKVAKRITSKLSSGKLSVIEPAESMPPSGLFSRWGTRTLTDPGRGAASGSMKALPALPQFAMGTNPPHGTASAFGIRGGTRLDGMTGTFYDLSLNGKRVPRGGSMSQRTSKNIELVQKFMQLDWNPKVLSEACYQAPERLVNQQFWLPGRYSGEAPTAFGVTLSSGSPQWVIHYQSLIEAPDETPFRFVGAGEDCFWIRWDRKIALASCYKWTGVWMSTYSPDFKQTCPDSFHCESPKDNYETIAGHFKACTGNAYVFDLRPVLADIKKHPSKPTPEILIGSMRAGPWITPVKGQKVPFEILLGTLGHRCEVFLAVEWAAGPKSAKGAYKGTGKLQMFRCGNPGGPNRMVKREAMSGAETSESDAVFRTS